MGGDDGALGSGLPRRAGGGPRGVDACDLDVLAELLAALEGVGVVVLDGGLQNPRDLGGKVGALAALLEDEALERGGLEGAVDQQGAELEHVELDVGVGELVKLVHEVVVDARGGVPVEVTDGEPAVEEAALEQPQQRS